MVEVVKIKIFGPVFLGFSPEIDPATPLDRPGAPGTSICTKNQPRRPILRPFREVFRDFSPENRPRDPLRSTGRPPDINLHQKSAPQTNSKAISRGTCLAPWLLAIDMRQCVRVSFTSLDHESLQWGAGFKNPPV